MAKAKITLDIDAKAALKATNDLDNSIGGVVEQTKSAKAQLKEMKAALLELEPGTEEFVKMAQKAAELEDAIGDVNAQVRALSSDTFKLDAATGVLTGMAGAYGMAQSAAALLGVENEDLMKTMVKLQAIQGVVNGLTQVSNMLNKDSAAGIALRNTGTKLLNFLLGTQAKATVGATTTTKALGVAMRALPIFLIIGAITALISAFSSFNKSQEEAKKKAEEHAEAQRKAREEMDKQNKSIADQSGKFVGLIYQLKATNANSDERLKLINQINDTYGLTLQNLSDETAFHEQLNVAINEYIDLQRTKFMLNKNQERVNELLAKELELNKLIKRDYDEINANAQRNNITFGEASRNLSLTDKEYRKNLKTLEDVKAELLSLGASTLELNDKQNQLTGGGKKYEEQTKKTTKAVKEQKNETDELSKAIAAFYDALEADRQRRLEGEEKDLQDAANRYDNLVALADKAGQDTRAITEQYQNDVTEINKKWQKIREDAAKEALDRETQLRIDNLVILEEIAMQEAINDADSEEERIKIRKLYGDKITQLKIQQLETERDILLSNTELTEEERQAIIAKSELEILRLREVAIDEVVESTENKFQTMMQNITEEIQVWSGTVMNIFSAIGDYMDMLDQNAQIERENRYNAETELLQQQLNERAISQEEFDAKERNLKRAKDAEDLKLRRKQFEREKKMNIVMAVMNTAQAVLQALGGMPPPASFIMAALAGVLGGIQIATIAGQKFQAARGGVVPGTTRKNVDSVPSMLAPGEAVINARSASMFPNLLSEVNQLGGGVPLAALPTESGAVTSSDPVFTDNKPMTVKVNVGVQEITDVQDRLTRYNELNEF
jgi:DNA repair exonuclease SbcCD ATPase subunit